MTYLGKDDPLFAAVKQMVAETGKSSISRIQRKFLIGHSRVVAMLSALADEGVIMRNELDMHDILHSDNRTAKDETHRPPIIRVMGIGGCGINAINRMVEKGIRGAEFIAISPDTSELARSKADQMLYLSCSQDVTPEQLVITISNMDRRNLKALIAGADILFVVAGMGGCTGTGIAPIAANIARELGILNIAVVTTPLPFEGDRPHLAEQGVRKLSGCTDALILVPNEMLQTGTGQHLSDLYAAANNWMHVAISGITEPVSGDNLIGLDVTDLRMIFSDAGTVTLGTASTSGAARAKTACERAMTSIFLSAIDLANARIILLNITASSSMKLREVVEILEGVHLVAMDAEIIAAAVFDESMGDELRLTLFATGLPSGRKGA